MRISRVGPLVALETPKDFTRKGLGALGTDFTGSDFDSEEHGLHYESCAGSETKG